jgi:CDP-ribitol ribitolphosphotransferase
LKKALLRVVAFSIQAAYGAMKILKTRQKITMISRQADTAPADFLLIQSWLGETHPGVQVRILARRLRLSSPLALAYPFHILRQLYHIATSRVVVLDGYCLAASIPVHKRKTKIMQIWHASAAIKKFGWQTVGKPSGTDPDTAAILRMHENYDYILAPSKITGGIYLEAFRAEEGQLIYGGLPHLSTLDAPSAGTMEAMRQAYGLDGAKKIILYIPTFREGKCIRLEGLESGVDYSRYELIVRVHPLDRLPAHGGNIITADRFTTQEWMQLADVVITDYSSLMVEAALLAKPLYLYVYDIEEYRRDPGLNMDFDREEIKAMTFREADRLLEQLERPYDFGMLARFKDKYIECEPSEAARSLGKFLAQLAEEVDTNEKES